jgi:hypothetical protein
MTGTHPAFPVAFTAPVDLKLTIDPVTGVQDLHGASVIRSQVDVHGALLDLGIDPWGASLDAPGAGLCDKLGAMHASDVIALTSVVSSGVVGLSGVAFGALNGRRDRENARTIARVERHQTQRAHAYTTLLLTVNKVSVWAESLNPLMDTIPPQPKPPPPPLEQELEAEALVDAFGSAEVRKCQDEWRKAVNAIRATSHEIGLDREYPEGRQGRPVEEDPWLRLFQEQRPEMERTRKALAARIASELATE